MNITIDERRIEKMQKKLGKATKLISDEKYLPMFRNRQINYEKEFEFSVKLAKKKRDPRKYFAFIWSRKNLSKTVDWLRKLIAQAKERHAQQMNEQLESPINTENLHKLTEMKRQYNLLT